MTSMECLLQTILRRRDMTALPTDKKQKIWEGYCEEEQLRQKYQTEAELGQKKIEELSSEISKKDAELAKWHQAVSVILDFMQPKIEKMIDDKLKGFEDVIQSMIDGSFEDEHESNYRNSLGLDA